MNRYLILAGVSASLMLPAIASAQQQPADAQTCNLEDQELLKRLEECRPKPKKRVRKKHRRKKVQQPPPAGPKGEKGDVGDPGPEGPQGPAGEAGPPGPAGPAGTEGSQGQKGDVADSGFNFGIGIAGMAYGPGDAVKEAWGWGPALRLKTNLASHTEFGGTAAILLGADDASWSPGNERGLLLEVAVTRYLKRHKAFGFNVGFSSVLIGLKDRGDLTYFGLTPGLVYKLKGETLTTRFEVGALVALSDYTRGGTGWDVGIGGLGSLIFELDWSKL